MMQVNKDYPQPFLLEPTKLGRIVDTIHQRLADHASTTTERDTYEVFMTGNRREVMTSVDDVLALDNSRRHRITRLLVSCSAGTPGIARAEHEVQVDFACPKTLNGAPGKVVAIVVRSDAPGWASRTLSEVEEQVERTWLRRSQPLIILFVLLLAGLFLLASQFLQFSYPGANSQFMWLNQADLARVQALLVPNHTLTDQELREIATMQLRNVTGPQPQPRPMQSARSQSRVFLVVPLIAILGCVAVLLITCYPSVVFLWGDQVERYNNALQRRKALWGVIISVAVGGILSKLLFEWVAVSLLHHP